MAQITASMVKELREMSGVGMMECKKALVEAQGDMETAKELLRKTGQAKALKKSARETHEGGIGLHVSQDKKQGALSKLACETDFVAKNEKFKDLLNQLAQLATENGTDDFVNQPFAGKTVQEGLVQAVGELGENIQFLDAKALQVESGIVGGYVHMTGKIGVLLALETEQANNSEALQNLAKDIAMHIAASQAEAVSEEQIPQEVLEKEKEIFTAQARESGKPENIIEKMIEGRLQKFKKEVCVLSQPFVKNPDQTVGALLTEVGQSLQVGIVLKSFVKFQF